MSDQDDVKRLVAFARQNKDGFTARFKGGKLVPVKGTRAARYSVAGETSIVYVPSTRKTDVYSMPKEGGTVGGWYDRETGRYLIENVDLVSGREDALRLARRRKQKAVFDLIRMSEIKLKYHRREHITGMRIKTVSKKKMGEYVALHGKLPKNELPKRFRHIPKKDVLIRSDVEGTRRRKVLKHERIELKLMDEGMRYKQAHRKTERLMRKSRPKDVIVRRNDKWFNTLTGNYVSEERARKINSFFRRHPGKTWYEAQGRPVYEKNKKWVEQSEKLHRFYKHKKVQAVKTKDRLGNDVYFSPLVGKRLSKKQVKKAMKFDFKHGYFDVQLYRRTAGDARVYHIMSTRLDATIESLEDVDEVFRFIMGSWMRQAVPLVKEVHQNYPLGPGDVMYVSFDHDIIITNYAQKDNGAVNVMLGMTPDETGLRHLPEELLRAKMMYRKLIQVYRYIMLKRVRIYIYSFATHENLQISELRMGVYKRNGD